MSTPVPPALKRDLLRLDERVARASRVATLGRGASHRALAVDVVILLSAGVAAALLSSLLNFRLQIPGHRIILSIFPMALGLALAPRRGGGVVIGATALLTAGGLQAAGGHVLGASGMTSLVLAGPMLDLALTLGQSGSRLYGALVLAGAATNICALLVRAGARATGFSGGSGGGAGLPLQEWFMRAAPSHLATGILAGVVSAALWFRLRDRGG